MSDTPSQGPGEPHAPGGAPGEPSAAPQTPPTGQPSGGDAQRPPIPPPAGSTQQPAPNDPVQAPGGAAPGHAQPGAQPHGQQQTAGHHATGQQQHQPGGQPGAAGAAPLTPRSGPFAPTRARTPHIAWGLGSLAALLIGLIGPWVSVELKGALAGFAGGFDDSASGLSTGDGKVVLVLGLIAAAGIFMRIPLAVLIPSVLAALLMIYDLIDIKNKADVPAQFESSIDAGASWGLYLSLLAALSLIAWGALYFRNARSGA